VIWVLLLNKIIRQRQITVTSDLLIAAILVTPNHSGEKAPEAVLDAIFNSINEVCRG